MAVDELTKILKGEKYGMNDLVNSVNTVEDLINSNTYNCWNHPFIICEFSKLCSVSKDFYNSVDSCMSKYYESEYFSEQERKDVFDDTTFYKWAVFSVELFTSILNKISHRIDDYFGDEYEFAELTRDVDVLPMSPVTDKSLFDKKLHIRPSELSSISTTKDPCRIASILSKSDKDLLSKYGDISSWGDFYARVGTAMHRLYNDQPPGKKFIHNVTLSALGIKPHKRDVFCEVDVRGSHNGILWGGSCDSLLKWGDNILIEDLKRFRHTVREQHGKVLQTLAYALGAVSGTERFNNSQIIAGTIKRNVTAKSIKHRYPRTNMTMIGPEYIRDFNKELEQRAEFQQDVDNDQDKFFEEIKTMELKDKGKLKDPILKKLHKKRYTCTGCFSEGLCNSARKALKDCHSVQDILEDKYTLV